SHLIEIIKKIIIDNSIPSIKTICRKRMVEIILFQQKQIISDHSLLMICQKLILRLSEILLIKINMFKRNPIAVMKRNHRVDVKMNSEETTSLSKMKME